MQRAINLFSPIISVVLLSSCSHPVQEVFQLKPDPEDQTLTERSCTKTNWFNHGHQIALNGQKVQDDEFLPVCQKVEGSVNQVQLTQGYAKGLLKYCSAGYSQEAGLQGRLMNFELCDTEDRQSLGQAHSQGLILYCDAKSAFAKGKQGVVYKYVCPKDLEAEFLVEYKKGRKEYLLSAIKQNDDEIIKLKNNLKSLSENKLKLQKADSQLDRDIASVESEIKRLQDENSRHVREMVQN